MKLLSITLKDLQILVRDRGTIFALFLLPAVFILLFGGLGAAAGAGETDEEEVALPVANLDAGGEASQALIDALNGAGGVKVELYGQADAEERLSQREIWWLLTIPVNFSADIAANQPVTLRLVIHPDADSTLSESVARVVNGVARDMALQVQLLDALKQMGEMQAASPGASEAFSLDGIVARTREQFERSRERPLVVVNQKRPVSLGTQEKEDEFEPSSASVAGFAVLFVFLASQTTAQSIYSEKRRGSFRRLLAAPISKSELLGGKLLPNLITTLVQVAVIFAVGFLVFPVLGIGRLTLGNDPLAWASVSLLIAICSTSLGVFIAAIARTEGQVSSLATAILWVAAIIGGSFLPTYFLPDLLQTVGKVVPQYWANQAYYDLLVRGRGLAEVTTEIIILLGFTAVFFVIGLWRFEFD